MNHAGIELQRFLHKALLNSDELRSRLGGAHVYDDVPLGRKPPYVIFANARYLETGADAGFTLEHQFWIHVWSQQHGRQEALELSSLVLELVDRPTGQMEHHWIANFQHQSTEVEQDQGSGLYVARMRFRAVTEPWN